MVWAVEDRTKELLGREERGRICSSSVVFGSSQAKAAHGDENKWVDIR